MTTLEGPPLSEAEGVGALTLGGFLLEVADRFAPNEALVFDDPLLDGSTTRWTYAELGRQARRVAAALMADGAGAGTRVGILMGSRPEAVAAFFGAGLCGATAVPLSTFAPVPELEYLLGHADIEVLLTQTALVGRRFVDELGAPPRPPVRHVAAVGAGSSPGWADFLSSGAAVTDADVEARASQVSPAGEGTIIYSSGTTDRPKGILHAQRAPALQFWLQARVFGRCEQSRMWMALPMFWTAGLNTGMGATLAAGGCWVMQETFQPSEALRLMARERVTEPYTLPHQTAALSELPEWPDADLSSLRCVFGKSAFARHPAVHGDPAWNMPNAYGLSETCSIFATHYSSATRDEMKASTGRLLPGNRLRVVDPQTGQSLGPGQEGELAVAGPTRMERYVGQAPGECLDADGFFHTGDAGHYDEDGNLHWTGRRTEMIKTGGANISPAEIEIALRAYRPVKLSRVLGWPDPRMGQIAVLCVVLRDGEQASADDIRDFLRERVATYKVPRQVLFFTDGEVPMTASDTKVRDAALIRLVEDRLSRSPSPTPTPGVIR